MSTTIDNAILERIAFLQEQVRPDNNRAVNESLLHQVAILKTADLQNLDKSILMRRAHLRKTGDPRETERLFCELEVLNWIKSEVLQHRV